MIIKQNEATAARRTILIGPLANTADDSAYTSTLTGADLRISKAGAAEANSAGTATHIANGLFKYEFAVGEVDTFGEVSIRVAKSGVYGDVFKAQVVAVDLYDVNAFGLARLDATVSSRLPTSSYEAPSTLLDAADGVETGVTLRQNQRALAAMLVGLLSGARTGTETFRGINNGPVRVVMTVDASGNRTSIALSL